MKVLQKLPEHHMDQKEVKMGSDNDQLSKWLKMNTPLPKIPTFENYQIRRCYCLPRDLVSEKSAVENSNFAQCFVNGAIEDLPNCDPNEGANDLPCGNGERIYRGRNVCIGNCDCRIAKELDRPEQTPQTPGRAFFHDIVPAASTFVII